MNLSSRDQDDKNQLSNSKDTWAQASRHPIVIFAIIIVALHLFQPDINFRPGTSCFLRPLSPVWIAVPFSLIYNLNLWVSFLDRVDRPDSVFNLDTNASSAVREKHGIKSKVIAGTLSAITLNINTTVLFLNIYVSRDYHRLPKYEVGNWSSEGTWAVWAFLAFIRAGAPWLFLIYIEWLPTARLVLLCQKDRSSPKGCMHWLQKLSGAGATSLPGDNVTAHRNNILSEAVASSNKSNDVNPPRFRSLNIDPERRELYDILENFRSAIADSRRDSATSCQSSNADHWKTMYESLYGRAQMMLEDVLK